MNGLIRQIRLLQKLPVAKCIKRRLDEFSSFGNKSEKEWFSELCFCILTANSKAKTALAIQNELGPKGFITCSVNDVVGCIKRNKHRFHNNKARFIVYARQHLDIKKKVQRFDSVNDAREWLVENIKGIGYKEASHFLRNVGYFDVAILDRHILNLMVENDLIKEKPTLNKKNYMKIEKKFINLADRINMTPAELDMYMWYIKAGEVLK